MTECAEQKEAACCEKQVLVKVSKVKEVAAKDFECSLSTEAVDALTGKVVEILKVAADRAKGNKRKTIKACDL